MKVLMMFLFLLVESFSFTQDTIRYGKDFIIYKEGKIIQKEFFSSKNYIKIVYVYNEFGVLTRRLWYNKDGKLLSVSLDD